MKRFLRLPSPAMIVAVLALFVATSGVSYAVATISSAPRPAPPGRGRTPG